jgi:hypothetical protein
LSGDGGSVIGVVDQRQQRGICWDERILRKMNSFEGALIRRADVALEV